MIRRGFAVLGTVALAVVTTVSPAKADEPIPCQWYVEQLAAYEELYLASYGAWVDAHAGALAWSQVAVERGEKVKRLQAKVVKLREQLREERHP